MRRRVYPANAPGRRIARPKMASTGRWVARGGVSGEEFVKALLVACGLVVALSGPAAAAQSDSTAAQQHAFDFEFGVWKARISRLKAPLTGSKEWVEYEGTSAVRRVWDGKANLGEL